ncbi:MAG: hypothetical protein BAJATHORv1_30280 [Candidatus Thorarchaeota archaeon]|nr:MAG: hypothetical protein BAJATHORv1_30280 [Candidatus Thorarchaeota archaeon]
MFSEKGVGVKVTPTLSQSREGIRRQRMLTSFLHEEHNGLRARIQVA